MLSKTNWSTVKYKFAKIMHVLMSKRFGLGLWIRDDLLDLDSTFPNPDQKTYFMEVVEVPDAQDLLLVPNYVLAYGVISVLNNFAS
jgi:hypothetical protein